MRLSLHVPSLVVAVVISGAVAGGLAYAASPGGIPPDHAALQAVPRRCTSSQCKLAQRQALPSVHTVVRFTNVSLRRNRPSLVTAKCAQGEVATGGGWDVNSRTPKRFFQNRPLFAGGQGDVPSGWAVEAEASARIRLQVFAICASIATD
jgi:hypothetical protein